MDAGYDNGPVGRPPLGLHETTADRILRYIHYSSSTVLLVFFIAVFTIRSIQVTTPPAANNTNATTPSRQLYGSGGKPLPRREATGILRAHDKKKDFPSLQKAVFLLFSALTTGAFAASGFAICIRALTTKDWWCGPAVTVYIAESGLVFIVLTLSLIDAKPAPTVCQFSSWTLAFVIEAVRLSLFLVQNGSPRRMDIWNVLEVIFNLMRIVFLLGLIIIYLLLTRARKSSKPSDTESSTVNESTGLPTGHNGSPRRSGSGAGYGSVPNGHQSAVQQDDVRGHEPGWTRPKKTPSRGWWEYVRGYTLFFPYVWPSNDRRLQLIVVTCLGLVFVQRAFNVLVPYQLGVITNVLSGDDGPKRIPFAEISLYIIFRCLQGSNGLLGAARAALWIPIQQFSYRKLSVFAFEHVHSLSLDFHLNKKTGELVSALGKGKSINNFLDQATFQVLPMIIDLVVAIGYFLVAYDVYYALVVGGVTFWYIYFTMKMAKWRSDARREMVNFDRETDAIKNDSFLSYETVKYFNAEEWEFNRFKRAIARFQTAEYTVMMALSMMNVVQLLVFLVGLLMVCLIAAYQVSIDYIKVGKFVSLVAYMAQLQTPLNYFGTFYRVIQNAMINSERLLELLKERPTVTDKPAATALGECKGDIRFRNVDFAYDARKPALNGMDFHCKPGTTTAFVGESGGGKSTVFRLMFRYYNATAGSVEIDGRNVQDVTISSLRSHIGVVPQDTILFNESIMYNLKYARPDATDEDVYEAARAASIHDRILHFPDGYRTQVGERGLRLSGGEKQRVAIARTILKRPKIIMLDEATAALDTDTEQHTQKAFETLAQGRTMLVIAHRLSTITNADQILVLNEGKVVEKGTHQELLERNGRYRMMWSKQSEAHQAAVEAYELKKKATRLRREPKGDATLEPFVPSSNEGSDEDKRDRRHRPRKNRSRSRDEQNRSDDEAQVQHDALKMRHHEH